MKTKILLATILLLTLFSCKSDDESSGTRTIPADQKFLSKVTDDAGATTFSIEYTTDKKIKKIVSDIYQVRYDYDQNGRIVKSYLSLDGAPTIITDFEHDANGNIVGYTQDDVEYVVEKINNKYFFINHNDAYEIEFNAQNEVIKLKTGETQLDFFLVDGKSGPFSNTNKINIYDCISNPFYYFYFSAINNLTHVPIEEILGGSSPITFQNEYDEHGFLKRSVLSTNVGGEPQVVNLNYQYIKL